MDIQKAIEWMKDMQEYCEDVFRPVDKEASDYIFAALKELEQYREAGTPDECRVAREKQVPRKPVEDKYHHTCCPVCGWVVCYDEGWGEKYVPHCENCGQAIDWSGFCGETENSIHESHE